MLGAIIGDIIGSRFQVSNFKSKDFQLVTMDSFFTDDSVMTVAIAKAILSSKSDRSNLSEKAIYYMRYFGRKYWNCGYGIQFFKWLFSKKPKPYNSFGNGAAMRVSACGFAAKSLEEAKVLSRLVTKVTHNHSEGIKGAEATAVAIYLARTGYSILEIREYINKNYYALNFTLDDIRETYDFDITCQGSVPQAIEAFLESKNFEDAMRNAISIGGDSDTIAAITGSIAQAYYGIPSKMREIFLKYYLNDEFLEVLYEFENSYMKNE
ncbi:MAG: ADP-ribosylglycohydrolase family protein, partial [Anaeroplasmataceae bacterium]|nr:ADP-ribosylglycohydrolase family protein [Anaeroplasmataceae bacterium]